MTESKRKKIKLAPVQYTNLKFRDHIVDLNTRKETESDWRSLVSELKNDSEIKDFSTCATCSRFSYIGESFYHCEYCEKDFCSNKCEDESQHELLTCDNCTDDSCTHSLPEGFDYKPCKYCDIEYCSEKCKEEDVHITEVSCGNCRKVTCSSRIYVCIYCKKSYCCRKCKDIAHVHGCREKKVVDIVKECIQVNGLLILTSPERNTNLQMKTYLQRICALYSSNWCRVCGRCVKKNKCEFIITNITEKDYSKYSIICKSEKCRRTFVSNLWNYERDQNFIIKFTEVSEHTLLLSFIISKRGSNYVFSFGYDKTEKSVLYIRNTGN